MLEANGRQQANVGKTQRRVQRNRRGVLSPTDHGDHLAIALLRRGIDQRGKQAPPDAVACQTGAT